MEQQDTNIAHTNPQVATRFHAGTYDVIVVGGGHGGVEAALASARLGCRTLCITLRMDSIGNLPCNPAIGGTGKGHLVRELDALGGEMGKIADKSCIQYRLLNRGKGAAVWSLRAQADRLTYQWNALRVVETQENLDIKQAEVADVTTEEGAVTGIVTGSGAWYHATSVVLCTGTSLGGRTITGELVQQAGPDNTPAATLLTKQLVALGIPIRRFKTGTPPRVASKSIDFDKMTEQAGEEGLYFSFQQEEPIENKVSCFLTYTCEKTHQIIRDNLHRSPLFSGVIEGVGPRYCPSIEDKIVRFADKDKHQIFLEPMGLTSEEYYVQGLSSSLPEQVQLDIIRSITGLERAEITRPAYAIEYDCIDPTCLLPTLETKGIKGLFTGGQCNGSSGYEEAAVQGFVAGVNGALRVLGREPFVIGREEGYIGVLIDDLVTKGTEEPYRMMTSRTEYRLLHRQDNAQHRLCHRGYEIGLVSKEIYDAVLEEMAHIKAECKRLETTGVSPNATLDSLLATHNEPPIANGTTLASLLRRPWLTYAAVSFVDEQRPPLSPRVVQEVEITLKYQGYIDRQQRQVAQMKKLEHRPLPADLDYSSIHGLRLEARQKLEKIRPQNLGQAGRVSGVSPADVSVLMMYLAQKEKRKKNTSEDSEDNE